MSPAQMLFTHVVSDAPVPTVCQALQSLQTNLNKANLSKSVPKEVCDSSTCVSPGIHFLFSCPDKESDLWQNKNDLSAPGRLRLSKELGSHNTHLLSPGDSDSRVDRGVPGDNISIFSLFFGYINIRNDIKMKNKILSGTFFFHL